MTIRKYSSRSQQTNLSASLTASALEANVVSVPILLGGLTISPGETFTAVIDPDTALEEIIDVTATLNNTLTISRGVDTATPGVGQAHSAGAVVRHMAIGRDYRESNLHIESGLGSAVSTSAHGVNFNTVVKTSDTGTVTNGMIAANAVTTPKIADLNVTTGKLADSAVTSAKIADLTIATGDIADLAITAGKIADSAITSAKIADLTIATGDIADSAITSAKIAEGTIVAGDIADGAVTSAKILNDTIVNADINSSAAISYSKLNLASSITSSDIVNETIVNADVNTSAQIAYGKLNLTNAIVNADISASAAIDKIKISGTAVTIADTGTVTSIMIADGTIVNSDINGGAAIALSKLETDPLARANHTGTQLANTISNLDTTIKSYKVTDLTAPTTSVSVNSQTITNVATPVNSTDAANKAYADTKIASTLIGANSGVAPLDVNGKVPLDHIPATAIAEVFVVASEAAMLAISGSGVGDIAIRSDLNKSFILRTTPGTTLSNWNELLTPTDIVLSVDGQVGVVNLSTTYATIAQDTAKLPLTGGTMSGAIAMGSNKITGLGTPTTTGDAATKDYADTKLALTGGTLSGALSMGANKITNLADPTALTDAMTLNYFNSAALAPSNLTGPITSIGPATSIASQTGTGTKFVMDTSPTLITPELGVATATSINGTVIPASKTLVATDSTTYVVPSQTGNTNKVLTTDGTTSSWSTSVNGTAIPASKTLVVTTDKLSALAATTSAELAGVILDETGSGALVFGTSPSISNLTITGTLTAASTVGTTNQFLQSTGTGIQWASISYPTISTSLPSGGSNGDLWYVYS